MQCGGPVRKMLVFIPAVLAMAGVLIPVSAFSQEHWKLHQERDGISLFAKTPSEGKLKHYKAVFSVAASPKTCISILYHPQYHPDFMDGVKSAELLRQANDTSLYFYYVIDLPWPIPNRDMVTHAAFGVSSDARKLIVKLRSAPQEKEPSAMTRAVVPAREWLFERTSEMETSVTYYYIAETDHLPYLLEDVISIDGPLKMLSRFRSLAGRHATSVHKLAWLDEL